MAVRADRVYLGADVPGHDRVHFRLRAADRHSAHRAGPGWKRRRKAAASWGGRSLDIFATDREGRKRLPVRTFKGMDLPPRLIRWDGRGEDGAALAPGFYAFRLSAVDKAGNRSETAWQLVELGPLPSAGKIPADRSAPKSPRKTRHATDAETGTGTGEKETGTGAAPDSGLAPPPILEGDD